MIGLVLTALCGWAEAAEVVSVETLDTHPVLAVDGQPFFVRGMNWGYIPVGHNYSYDFWGQDPDFIEAALRYEMGLLKAGGVNAIRQYDVIPPQWVTWIYEEFGIRTAINPLIGRYGATIQGRFVPSVDYSDPVTRDTLIDQTVTSIARYRDTPGVLLYMLGNESNYGLHWTSFEIEALPEEERHTAKAVHLYTLFGEITRQIQTSDPNHPVAIVNGDLQYIDLIAEHMPTLDILGTNVYRGISARDLYEEVDAKLGIPVMYTEFGADAYDAKAGREDHVVQARYLHGQWREIYEQSALQDGVGNAIGGFVFQWSDGWWKYKQEENLDIHDTNASWPNGGYAEDFVDGQNNMNEEWFGICAKGPPDTQGLFPLFPRASYYVLQHDWTLDPYADTTDANRIEEHFSAITPADFDQRYRTSLAAGQAASLARARVKNARLDFRTYTTDDSLSDGRPQFDHLQSFYADIEVQPSDTARAHVELNVLGNVPVNPIDPIFYEARGRDTLAVDPEGDEVHLGALERLRVYRAGFDIEARDFRAIGYVREGHFHWGYEGDFWGLYPEANYGPNTDIYNADAPVGMEIHGKRAAEPFKIAFGPQVYWGANPTAIAKFYDTYGSWTLGLVHMEDFAVQPQVASSLVVPELPTRRTGLLLGWARYGWTVEAGGLMSGTERIGWTFSRVEEAGRGPSYADSGYHVIDDEIRFLDTLGSKLKITVQRGRLNAYVQGMIKGLVANSGFDARQTFTGYAVRESGRGNQMHASGGLMLPLGDFTIGPNALWQKPLLGPNPALEDRYDPTSNLYEAVVRPRNIRDDPFAVLDNREMTAAELVFTYDPTPGSWLWAWDNDIRETSSFAASLNLIYRHQPTSRDANLGFTEENTLFAFPSAPPAADLYEVKLRWVSALASNTRLVGHGWIGTYQARGDDDRLVQSGGGDVAIHGKHLSWLNWGAVGAWGPYDYHRDFNFTYPLQGRSELSWRLAGHRLVIPPTRIGTAIKARTLDRFSAPFTNADIPARDGSEWEWMTFAEVTL